MRAFWAIIAIMVVVTAVLYLGGGGDGVDVNARSTSSAGITITDDPDGVKPADSPKEAAESSATSPEKSAADELAADIIASAEQRVAESGSGLPPEVGSNSQPWGTATTPPPVGADAGAGAPHSGHQTPKAPLQPPDPTLTGTPPAAGPVRIAKNEDGSVTLDDRFVVRGSGSVEDPYQLSWDLLVSAAETYQPRRGMTDVPERVMMLNGKHVKIAGYLVFPMAQAQSDEVLVMMNMWDGCCIGVPPSPYDALEVKLGKAVTVTSRGFMNFATLSGVLKVDPYVVNDWLLGLYLVEEGSLDFGM